MYGIRLSDDQKD